MTQVVAHRGASAQAPENTLAAFRRAAELGADGVELDVQLTADAHVVCIHDETLDRTTSGSGPVANATLAEISALDASAGDRRFHGERVPTLDSVLAWAASTRLSINIELKNATVACPGLEEAVVGVVSAHGMSGRVLVSTFNHISAANLAAGGELPVGLLFKDVLFEPWRYAATVGAAALHPNWRYLAAVPETVQHSHGLGQAVCVWTVDDPATIRFCEQLGVDSLITNEPDTAIAALRR